MFLASSSSLDSFTRPRKHYLDDTSATRERMKSRKFAEVADSWLIHPPLSGWDRLSDLHAHRDGAAGCHYSSVDRHVTTPEREKDTTVKWTESRWEWHHLRTCIKKHQATVNVFGLCDSTWKFHDVSFILYDNLAHFSSQRKTLGEQQAKKKNHTKEKTRRRETRSREQNNKKIYF